MKGRVEIFGLFTIVFLLLSTGCTQKSDDDDEIVLSTGFAYLTATNASQKNYFLNETELNLIRSADIETYVMECPGMGLHTLHIKNFTGAVEFQKHEIKITNATLLLNIEGRSHLLSAGKIEWKHTTPENEVTFEGDINITTPYQEVNLPSCIGMNWENFARLELGILRMGGCLTPTYFYIDRVAIEIEYEFQE